MGGMSCAWAAWCPVAVGAAAAAAAAKAVVPLVVALAAAAVVGCGGAQRGWAVRQAYTYMHTCIHIYLCTRACVCVLCV